MLFCTFVLFCNYLCFSAKPVFASTPFLQLIAVLLLGLLLRSCYSCPSFVLSPCVGRCTMLIDILCCRFWHHTTVQYTIQNIYNIYNIYSPMLPAGRGAGNAMSTASPCSITFFVDSCVTAALPAHMAHRQRQRQQLPQRPQP